MFYQSILQHELNEEEDSCDIIKNHVRASFVVAHQVAKKMIPLRFAGSIQEVCVDLLNCYGEAGRNMASIVRDVPLSRRTITNRIEKIGKFCSENLKSIIQESKYVSLGLDETTDVSNLSQLLIGIRAVNANFEITETPRFKYFAWAYQGD